MHGPSLEPRYAMFVPPNEEAAGFRRSVSDLSGFAQGRELELVLIAEPGRVVAVIGEVVSGQRMEEDIETAAVENEEGQDFTEQFIPEGDLIAPLRMGTDRKIAPPPHRNVESRLDRLAQDRGGRLRLRRVVDMSVIALDGWGLGWFDCHGCRLLACRAMPAPAFAAGAAMTGLYLIGGKR